MRKPIMSLTVDERIKSWCIDHKDVNASELFRRWMDAYIAAYEGRHG